MCKKGDIEIWTTEETAKFLRVTGDYVRSMARQRAIPHHRLNKNGKILFIKSKVIEWFLCLEQEIEDNDFNWDEDAQRQFIDQHLTGN